METIFTLIGILAIIPLLVFYGSISWGFVISKFYIWFILTTFPLAPHITILQFIGISFFLNAIMPKRGDTHIKKEYKNENEFWVSIILGPWITLLCGYVLYCFY